MVTHFLAKKWRWKCASLVAAKKVFVILVSKAKLNAYVEMDKNKDLNWPGRISVTIDVQEIISKYVED